ncbi:MAG: flagellar hook-length control protein FliK [Desulfovibrio sp.]|uniref:flagellar hook-length control protein FliK n=1 Tax=Desulfovibrio sp. 7SRBS1 TaxID=3378064 RepID=UPI003B3C4151
MQFIPAFNATEQSTNSLMLSHDASQVNLQAASTRFDALLEQTSNAMQQMQDTVTEVRNDLTEQGRQYASQYAHRRTDTDNASGAASSFKKIKEMSEDDSALDTPISKSDIHAIRKSLKKQGFTDDEISDLEERASSQAGMTWADFIGVVQAKIAGLANAKFVDLTQEDRNNLLSLFQKVGFDPKKAEQLVKDISDGKGGKVMKQLQTQLDKLASDSSVSINKEEMAALAKAMNVGGNTASEIASFLQKTGTEMSPDALKSALALMQKDMAEQVQASADSIKELQKDIRDLLNKALAKTGNGQDDSAKQIQASKDAKAAAEFVGKEAKNDDGKAQADANGADDSKNKQQLKDDAAVADKNGKQTSDEDTKKQTKLAKAAAQTEEQTDDLPKPDTKSTSEKSEMEALMDKLTGKVNTTAANPTGQVRSASEAANAKANLFDAKSGKNEILKQIETGVLKGASNGAKQLTIQLKPVELGTVQVMLHQSKNGELKAMIRTENADVTKAVADQLAHVKETLAQQGVKVSQVEVQTGLARDSMGQQWNGQQHNMEADHEAMARIRTRMRNLRGQGLAANISQNVESGVSRRFIGQGRVHYVA